MTRALCSFKVTYLSITKVASVLFRIVSNSYKPFSTLKREALDSYLVQFNELLIET